MQPRPEAPPSRHKPMVCTGSYGNNSFNGAKIVVFRTKIEVKYKKKTHCSEHPERVRSVWMDPDDSLLYSHLLHSSHLSMHVYKSECF